MRDSPQRSAKNRSILGAVPADEAELRIVVPETTIETTAGIAKFIDTTICGYQQMARFDSVRRRGVLASSVSFCLGLAGCSSVFDESSEPETHHPPPLHEIRLVNRYDEQKRATLIVERNGKITCWDTYALPAKSQNRIISISDEEWMGCGTYEVTTKLQGESQTATLDFRDVEPSKIANGKVQPIELSLGYGSKGIDFSPVHIDDPLINCEGTTGA